MATINIHEATLRTFSVEIKALTVGAKQVTLAVFRQLQNELIGDLHSMELRGRPWGRVHYFWGECAGLEHSGHLHIVWQCGQELRRCCASRATPKACTTHYQRQEDEWSAARAIIGQMALLLDVLQGDEPIRESFVASGWADWKTTRWKCRVDPDTSAALRRYLLSRNPGSSSAANVEANADRIRDFVVACWHQLPLEVQQIISSTYQESDDELAGRILEANDFVSVRRKRLREERAAAELKWKEHYNQFLALPQLFIAV